jgi:opacity protein-like surface antigen
MKLVSLAGVASAALILAVNVPATAQAADLGGARGSMKDYGGPMPVIQQGASGPCYFRADVGYSWSNDPTIKWPVDNTDFNNFTGTNYANGDAVSSTSRENGMLAEAGVGCGWGGSRGVRVEAMFGYRGDRKIEGEPTFYAGAVGQPDPGPVVDPLHTSIRTTTFMLNGYKDLGNFGGFTPYVGAGIGAAYHKLDDIYFTGNPNLVNRIHGDNDLAFAWSLMAGVGYQISDRATLDVGYRYIDMGKISSQRSDTGGGVNPAVHFDDLTAHEVKVGLRYSFGGGNDCCETHQPMK